MLSIALYQPDIPQNVGSILRLCACMETPCHIIGPYGFAFDERKLKRVAMDYIEIAQAQQHTSWEAFGSWVTGHGSRVVDDGSPYTINHPHPPTHDPRPVTHNPRPVTHDPQPPRLVLLTTKAADSLYDFTFRPDDILLLGRESAGVPQAVADACDARLRIPISAGTRSLNIAMAAAIALGEARRQLGGSKN